MKRIVIVALMGALLTGCAANVANTGITTSKVTDAAATCSQLRAELLVAEKQRQDAQTSGSWQTARNVGAGALGLFTLGLGWMAIDTGNGHSTDEQNAQNRVLILSSLLTEKGC
ncbi:hypothetical protein [Aeromonas phage yong1]|uniref:Lipoprotein n=2 Tax=Ahphunavirus TaxID=2732912 RepID=A0A249XL93_9CAUD|nr:hypothetical protein HOS18_gp31 [Aeromonas phage CF7]ASZ71977.1 hypothetical protein CF7_31 [Aeromonas phage CF7]UPI11682.1 hypothetical protein [Aeromonas phage yong1]